MLRNRSRRAVTTKKPLNMADHHTTSSLLSLSNNPSSPISSFLNSLRLFNGFLGKNLSDAETSAAGAAVSPTSILDTKNSSSYVNPFDYDERNLPKTPKKDINSANRTEKESIGLALIDSIIGEESDGSCSKAINRMALFGSKLKVQIPAADHENPVFTAGDSPESPADFGIKTRSSQPFSPFLATAKDFSRQLSLKEMELSEDYTCVITRGPNPKTTHIFDDCVVESCCGDERESSERENVDCGIETSVSASSPSLDFLSFCHNCRDVLEQGKDIYMYRGEKAFCSHECRCQEMFFEGMKNQESDDAY